MAFPVNPSPGDIWTTSLGVVYKYNATRYAWEILNQTAVGMTGLAGATGLSGFVPGTQNYLPMFDGPTIVDSVIHKGTYQHQYTTFIETKDSGFNGVTLGVDTGAEFGVTHQIPPGQDSTGKEWDLFSSDPLRIQTANLVVGPYHEDDATVFSFDTATGNAVVNGTLSTNDGTNRWRFGPGGGATGIWVDIDGTDYHLSTTGIQGPAGLQGGTGIQGVTGIQAEGIIGGTGVQGETGIQAEGIIGGTGIQGVTGVLGINGETGIKGLTGNTGVQGLQGGTGVKGLTGDTGVQGLQGGTGVQGVTGLGDNVRAFSWVVAAPAVGGIPGPRLKETNTATEISAATTAASGIAFNVEHRTAMGVTGLQLMSSAMIAGTTGMSTTTLQNTSMTAGKWLWLNIQGVTGAPLIATVTVGTAV